MIPGRVFAIGLAGCLVFVAVWQFGKFAGWW